MNHSLLLTFLVAILRCEKVVKQEPLEWGFDSPRHTVLCTALTKPKFLACPTIELPNDRMDEGCLVTVHLKSFLKVHRLLPVCCAPVEVPDWGHPLREEGSVRSEAAGPGFGDGSLDEQLTLFPCLSYGNKKPANTAFIHRIRFTLGRK